MHHLSCDVFFFFPWKIHSLSKLCSRNVACASKPLWGEMTDKMWHYKETNKTSLWRLNCAAPFMLSQISRHHFEGTENCFHNECGSLGNERDIWMGEHVEGSPGCTEVTAVPLGNRIFSCLSLKRCFLWSGCSGIPRFIQIRTASDQRVGVLLLIFYWVIFVSHVVHC